IYEVMEIARFKKETLEKEIQSIKVVKMIKESQKSSTLKIYLLDNLGKAFSTLGESLQAHYHYDSQGDMKKVS
ncbi:MAG: hypothetical protein PF518_10730, partial [Spirochaetaceae bacterium]|nr:hypothetical protein [Spirochaetaceae bacterium]